jgi:hypothetical protein
VKARECDDLVTVPRDGVTAPPPDCPAVAVFGAGAAGTVSVDGEETTAAPVGGVPDATAESPTEPCVTSAWVTV